MKDAQGSSVKIEKEEEFEITTNDLEESVVEKSVEDAQENRKENKKEKTVESTGEEQLLADTDRNTNTDSGTGIIPPQLKFLSPKVSKQRRKMTLLSGSSVTSQLERTSNGVIRNYGQISICICMERREMVSGLHTSKGMA